MLCHFCAWFNLYQILYLICYRRHSIWDNWQKNILIFSRKSAINLNFIIWVMLCIKIHCQHFSNRNNQHFATLLQGTNVTNAKLVWFSSRATTSVESWYPQLGLEALAINFGLRHFRQYVIGSPPVTIITDHKPLVGIFTNNHKGSIRTDCIKLCQQHIFYNVVWRQRSLNPSDYLSHHATPLHHLPHQIRRETSEFEKNCLVSPICTMCISCIYVKDYWKNQSW